MHSFSKDMSFIDNLLLAVIAAHPLGRDSTKTDEQRLNEARVALFGKGVGIGTRGEPDTELIEKALKRRHKDDIYNGRFGELFPDAKAAAISAGIVADKSIASNASALARFGLGILEKTERSDVSRVRRKIGGILKNENDVRLNHDDYHDTDLCEQEELREIYIELQKTLGVLSQHGVESDLK